MRTGCWDSRKAGGRTECPGYGPSENARRRCERADRLAVGFALELLAERAEAGAAVEDIAAIPVADLNARGVATVAQVPGLGRGRRSAHSPELDPHTPPFCGL